MNAQSPRPISRVRVAVLVGAVILAAGLALMGATLGARLYSEPAYFSAYEGGREEYTQYGWPWGWKTDAPREVIELSNSHSDGRFLSFRYDEHGYRPGILLLITVMWFVAALTVEALVWALAVRLRPLLR
jgi:hypothetical protein